MPARTAVGSEATSKNPKEDQDKQEERTSEASPRRFEISTSSQQSSFRSFCRSPSSSISDVVSVRRKNLPVKIISSSWYSSKEDKAEEEGEILVQTLGTYVALLGGGGGEGRGGRGERGGKVDIQEEVVEGGSAMFGPRRGDEGVGEGVVLTSGPQNPIIIVTRRDGEEDEVGDGVGIPGTTQWSLDPSKARRRLLAP